MIDFYSLSKKIIKNRENKNSDVYVINEADEPLFLAYASLFEANGFLKKEESTVNLNRYFAYYNGEDGIFISFYPEISEIIAVVEKNTPYFAYSDEIKEKICSPEITQVYLEDFGMSYAIKLSDGRYIVIDGGFDFEPDANRLFEALKKAFPQSKPVIAAWILTHPHEDHYHCFSGFMDKYGDEVVLEKVMFNFPESDDVEHYPDLIYNDVVLGDLSASIFMPRMIKNIEKSKAQVYYPHTGQKYVIGEAVCEILASMDDTIHISKNTNAASLVIRMRLGGQTILWMADAGFSYAKLNEKYGKYLKSDILQIPHHGFGAGTAESQMEGYSLINPDVCLLPVSDYCAYTYFCSHYEPTRYLMNCIDFKELITGSEERTISLPYTPKEGAKEGHYKKYMKGISDNGSRTWVFTGLSTLNEEDFCFDLLNMTIFPTSVDIELFFENSEKNVRFIKAEIPANTLKSISIKGSDVDGDALYFNRHSLKIKGIPENEPFAVRFISEIPIVVSNKNHKAAYISPVYD